MVTMLCYVSLIRLGVKTKLIAIGGHTNTERGYLPTLAKSIWTELATGSGYSAESICVEIHVSEADMHPLVIV